MIVQNRFLDGTNQRPKIIKIVILLLSFLTVTPRGTLDFKALYVTLFVNVCVSSSIHTKSLTTFDMVVVLELDITMYLQQESACGIHILDPSHAQTDVMMPFHFVCFLLLCLFLRQDAFCRYAFMTLTT